MAEIPAAGFAGRLAALSQPTRLKIIEVVAQGGAEGTAAGKIAQAVRCPASTLSFHLKELSQAGLLEATPDGRYIRYSVKADGFAELAAFISTLPGRSVQGKLESTARKPAAKRTAKRRTRKAAKEADETQQEEQLSIFED
jgi:DNA-binding transcriptional ArsR family regulator